MGQAERKSIHIRLGGGESLLYLSPFQRLTLRMSLKFGIIKDVEKEKLLITNDIATIEATRAVIARFKLKAQHRLGQNFLVSSSIVQNIVASADISPDEVVLEVGPGIGTLTQGLASRARSVLAVEVDRNLLPVLQFTLSNCPNVRVIHADIRKVSLDNMALEAGVDTLKVVANLPYYLTSYFIHQLVESRCFRVAVLMVQREVAQRLTARPGGKDYGILSVAAQYHSEISRVAQAGPQHFWPRPQVSSTVLRLVRRPHPPVEVGDEQFFFKLIRAAFGQRRKMLVNSLEAGLELPREIVREVMAGEGIRETKRAEELSLKEFAALGRAFLGRERNDGGGVFH